MSALFTASTSQSQLEFDLHSYEEININTNLGGIGPMSPSLQTTDNRGTYYK